MRWHDLFTDLESQAEAWDAAERDAEVADRSRAEQATVSLVGRLAASQGGPVALRVLGVGDLQGVLDSVGADWLLLTANDTERLVLTAAVSGVHDLGRRAEPPQARSAVLARLGVAAPLRAIARDRSAVVMVLRDGGEVTGTPERVGRDFVDIVLHELGEPGRSGGRGRLTVPFAALSQVRTTPSAWA